MLEPVRVIAGFQDIAMMGNAIHVGLCAEFPSLSWLAPTPEKALSGIRGLVGEVVWGGVYRVCS